MAAIALPPREEGAGTPQRAKPAPLDDQAILKLLDSERSVSIGFENSSTLEAKRRTALEYSKGVMTDVPSLANRSKAVSTDVAEAIETILPDLLDIFTGGEDVAAFAPVGEEDEPRAQQETDWVNHVAFQKLPGFLLLYTAIKDALQVDTGCLYTWWQDDEGYEDEEVKGKSAPELDLAQQSGVEVVSVTPAGVDPDGVELFDAVLRKKYDRGCIKSMAVDPSNLTVSQDATLDVKDNVYMAIRSFPRAQTLLDMGFDPEKVAQLPAYSQRSPDEQTEQARDVAGETISLVRSSEGSGPEGEDGKSLMRTVEVHKHFIRADIAGKGKSQLWQIETDQSCKVVLSKKEIDRRGLSVGTPFIQAHRFYGMSLAEKLFEIQKIKTALLRLMLDSGYFAMNQRTEVAMDRANEHTIADLMRNEPMVPVRSKTGDAVRPLQAGQLGFDPQMALEYVSTMGEQRTGIVRNAQGLNPDTLHDTAKGAQALMTMAQKRVRMIARVLAETLVKGWFLDIHALSRKHATRAEKMRLRGKWVDVDPSSFGDRSDMVIEVGVGAGGKEMELAILDKVMLIQKELIASGIPSLQEMASPEKVFAAAKRWCERGGLKAPELFFADPAALAQKKEEEKAMRAAQGIPEPEPPPSPDEMKIRGDLELKAKAQQDAMVLEAEKTKAQLAADQQATQAKLQADQQKAAFEAQQRQIQAEADMALKREQMAMDAQMRREQMLADQALKREQMQAEIELKRQQLNAELQMNMELERMKIAAGVYSKPGGVSTSEVHPGGEAGA